MLDITKTSDTDSFFSVYVSLINDEKKYRLIILNHDHFLYEFETLQRNNVNC